MATNLRLSPEAAAALRAAARKSGRSQQELLREAVDQFLGLNRNASECDRAVRSGLVRPPTAFRDTTPVIELPRGTSSLDLLDRDDDR
jgi:Ribbon-helix-helix protein, copG family